MAKSILAQVKQLVHADMVSRLRNGNILIRKGYFYRGNASACSFASNIKEQLDIQNINAKIVGCGDQWASFKGGKGVKANSHFWVEIGVDA